MFFFQVSWRPNPNDATNWLNKNLSFFRREKLARGSCLAILFYKINMKSVVTLPSDLKLYMDT